MGAVKVPIASSSALAPSGVALVSSPASSIGTTRNRLYALASLQESEASPDTIAGTLQLFSCDVCYLLDPWFTLSYVTPYVAICLGYDPEVVSDLFFYFYPVGELVIAKRVYRGCVVSVGSKQTLVDLFEMDICDFDIILGIDWLHSCYGSLDYQTHKGVFRFPGEPVIEWESGSLALKGRFISFLRAQRLISKRCRYHLVWVKNSNLDVLLFTKFWW